MQVHVRLCARLFRCLSVLAALVCSGAQSAYADCVSNGINLPLDLTLPSANIAVSPSLPLGATLGSVRVAAPQNIPFACSGTSNTREARFVMAAIPVTDFAGVYRTNLAGVGMRISVSGGSFAGIDDGPRLAPYKVPLPHEASHLTGFALQVDFIKTGLVQNGTLAAGKLVSVLVGGAELVDVAIPSGAVVFAANQCDAVRVGGAVATGIGSGGAFTDESIAVGFGCNPGIGVMVQLNQGYVYGSAPLLTHDNPDRKVAAAPDGAFVHHADRRLPDPNSIDATNSGPSFNSGAFDSNASGSGSLSGNTFGGNAFDGSSRAMDFRR